jgi:pimeloyl-ACP methyl ester carboxylesterase
LERIEVEVAGMSLSVLRGGRGPKLMLLHDEFGLVGAEATLSVLATSFELIVPIHPGFEDTGLTAARSVGDLALLYLRLLDDEPTPLPVLGASLGGWIALEMAVRCHHQISSLVLAAPTGVRFGGPEVRNFADLFALAEDELAAALYHDPLRARRVDADSPEELVRAWVRNQEATVRYGWEPYLHSPGLENWTRHLELAVLLLHGEDDRFVAPGYYDDFAGVLARCDRRTLAACGHFPLIEQPEASADAVRGFLAEVERTSSSSTREGDR